MHLLTKLFKGRGRINRKDYFLGTLLIWGVATIIMPLLLILSIVLSFNTIVRPIYIIYFILLVSYALQSRLIIKRLHDLGYSGWFLLILLTTLINVSFIAKIALAINIVFAAILLFKRGNDDKNKYGLTSNIMWFWAKWSKKIKIVALSIISILLLLPIIFLIFYIFFFRPFQITGNGMYPNLRDKEYVITNIIGLRFIKPKLGDAIVFKSPADPEKDLISRVIGIQGDVVMVKDGNVYLNNKILNEKEYLWLPVKTYAGEGFVREGISVTVPNDHYLVLGDNRSSSSDSRVWGFVPLNNVIGKIWFCYSNCPQNSPSDRISLIASSISGNVDNWKLFTSTEGNFTILFPSLNPKITYDKYLPLSSTSDLKFHFLQFSEDDLNGNTYSIEVATYPKDYIFKNSYDELTNWANDIAKNLNATLVSSDQNSFMNAHSLDLLLKSKAINYKYKIFEVGNRSYAISTSTSGTDIPFDGFVNSFKFIQDQTSPATTLPATNSNNSGFLSGQNNSVDIKSMQDYVNEVQGYKDGWQNVYSSGRYSQQDLDKLLDELTRMLAFSKTIINNLQSGTGTMADNQALWNEVVKMNAEAGTLTNKLNGN